ncbi:OmpA family protein [Comamonas sp.]|uniref:OmpA family protein n=1 Tax=Comamonas sp. TaxID=34028 RepID=UPI00289CE129|nr:OmpA family protein [Comamonas sp.]
MSQFNDSQTPMLVLAVSAALMALTVSYSVDAEPLGEQAAQTALVAITHTAHPVYEPPTLAPSAIVLQGMPAFRVEQGMVKLFFAPSKTDIPLSAESALQDIVTATQNGQRVQVSGFHDETGNAQQNIALSKKRAEVVQKRLIALGAPAQAIALKKPSATASTGNHAEARRVEVALLP